MDSSLTALFDQILEGYDIPKPESMLKVKQGDAGQIADSAPYSLLTNLAHATLWQRFWLQKLHGGRKKSNMTEWRDDFRVPDPDEWDGLRREFLAGLREARAIAAGELPFQCSDEEARDTLLRIAVHGAYHCGQMNLLKRMNRSAKNA